MNKIEEKLEAIDNRLTELNSIIDNIKNELDLYEEDRDLELENALSCYEKERDELGLMYDVISDLEANDSFTDNETLNELLIQLRIKENELVSMENQEEVNITEVTLLSSIIASIRAEITKMINQEKENITTKDK